MNLLIGSIASSWLWMTVLFIATLVAGAFALFSIFDSEKSSKVFGVVLGVLAVALGLFWFGTATTFVVNPASTTILTYSDGTLDPQNFSAGLHSRPLIGAQFVEFNSQENYQWCPDFTPSIKSGIEVKMTVCYRLDASKVDWRGQYLKWRKDQAGIMEAWRNELAGYVALVAKDLSITDLRSDRLTVAQNILAKTGAWSETSGVNFSSAVLSNWDFTNADVGRQYDAQVTAGMKSEAVVAEQQAAEQERTLQLYQADTYAQVLKARAQADSTALKELGLPQNQWSSYLINQRLMSYLESAKTPNIVVTVGGGQSSPFVYPTSVVTGTTP